MQVQSRRNVEPGWYQEPSGSYSFDYLDPIDGKWKGPKVAKGCTSLRAAKRWKEDVFLPGLREKKGSLGDETVSALADRWLATRKDMLDDGLIKERTYEADSQRRVRTVKLYWKDTAVEEVTTETVRGWLKALKQGGSKVTLSGKPMASKTRADTLHCLSQMFDFKLAEKGGGFNPCKGLMPGERPSQKREREPIELTPEQVGDFLYLTKEHAPAYLPLFTALAHTGMRIREALSVTWGSLDREEKTFSVTTSKQRAKKVVVETRLLHIGPSLEPVFGRQARMKARWSSDEDFVFAAGPETPKSYRNVRRALASVSEKMGLERSLRSHDFRHSLARNVRSALRTNEEKLAFCRSLGWVDTTMFDRVYGQGQDEKEKLAAIAADVLARAAL